MTKYVIRRVIQAIPVLFGITIVVYSILLAAPGRPHGEVRPEPADDRTSSESAFMKAWGLDQPIPIQYCRWLGVCNPDVDARSRSCRHRRFIGPTGWPNFLPTAISGADERPPPRRLRLLDRDRRGGLRR